MTTAAATAAVQSFACVVAFLHQWDQQQLPVLIMRPAMIAALHQEITTANGIGHEARHAIAIPILNQQPMLQHTDMLLVQDNDDDTNDCSHESALSLEKQEADEDGGKERPMYHLVLSLLFMLFPKPSLEL
jgi:hypothetical protein